jgi:glutamyl-tRNA reductase
VLASLAAEPWLSEVLVVSTCNRTEVYAVSPEREASSLLLAAVRRCVENAPPEEDDVWARRSGEEAARHLFRVVAGLESAILGETEIQGQVKEAHRKALAGKTVGAFLDRLVTTALKAGKRARTDTPLCRGAVSHGQAAYEVTRQVFGGLRNRTVLVVGAGEMARLAATSIAALTEGRFVVANRTRETADALARTLPQATVVGLDEVPARLAQAHVALFAGGQDALTRAEAETAAARRRDPLLLLDFGVPRCVDPAVVEIPGVFLYDIEAIERLLAKSLAGRREAVPAVETILESELQSFRAWGRTRLAVPAIRSLQAWAEDIRRQELRWLPADTPEPLREAFDQLSRRIVDKILRRPAARVRQGAEEGSATLPTADHLRNVFGLDEYDLPDAEGLPPVAGGSAARAAEGAPRRETT